MEPKMDLMSQQQERMPDVMDVPELIFEREWGSQLCSLLLRAESEDFGDRGNPIALQADAFFRDNESAKEVVKKFQSIIDGFNVDEETMYHIALAYDRPERMKKVVAMIERYKPDVTDPPVAVEKFFGILKEFNDIILQAPFRTELEQFLTKDQKERGRRKKETEDLLESVIDFFRPESATVQVRRVNYVPTDPIRRPNSGFAALLGDEQIIVSNIENVGNQQHEFLHGIVNPIVEKLDGILDGAGKKRIVEMARPALRVDYGDLWESLLDEELIRVFGDCFEDGRIAGYRDFCDQVNAGDDRWFQMISRDELTQDIFSELNIRTHEDLRVKTEEVFERILHTQQSALGRCIILMYQEYAARENQQESFERFFLRRFPEIIRNS